MEKFLYPTPPVSCNITGPSSSGKIVFLITLFLKNSREFEKIYIHSPSLH